MSLKSLFLSLCLAMGIWQLTPMPAFAETPQEIICKNAPDDQCESADENLFETLLRRVAKPLFFIAGAGAVVMIIVGGLRLVMSAGNQDAVKAAQGTIMNAAIGLGIAIVAYALVNYVVDKIGG